MEKIEAVDLAKKVSSVSCLYGINFIWSVRQEDLTKKNCISIRQAQRSEDGGKHIYILDIAWVTLCSMMRLNF